MGMWGGGMAGGWSTGIGGQQHGPGHARGSDGWDDEYLGKAYDGEVVRRILPYLAPYKFQATVAFLAMVVSAVMNFSQPLVIGFAVTAGVRRDEREVMFLLGVLVGNAVAIYFDIAAAIPWGWAIAAVVMVSVVAIVFGGYPALKASRLDPIESLRYE